jgi:hypothetical protein
MVSRWDVYYKEAIMPRELRMGKLIEVYGTSPGESPFDPKYETGSISGSCDPRHPHLHIDIDTLLDAGISPQEFMAGRVSLREVLHACDIVNNPKPKLALGGKYRRRIGVSHEVR